MLKILLTLFKIELNKIAIVINNKVVVKCNKSSKKTIKSKKLLNNKNIIKKINFFICNIKIILKCSKLTFTKVPNF